MPSLSITDSQALTVLRSFLLSILPGIEIIKGQANRVSEPPGSNYAVFTPIMRTRLSTNVDTGSETVFTGSITGTELTVSSIPEGPISVGDSLSGPNIATGTLIIGQGTGRGGAGTYVVSPSQTVATQTFYAGGKTVLQPTRLTVQIDAHGPLAADNAQIITTLFRDEFACTAFAASNLSIQPLYTSDPRQTPFINESAQYEDRWSVDAEIQINPVIGTAQQFAGVLEVGLINVDAEYPAV